MRETLESVAREEEETAEEEEEEEDISKAVFRVQRDWKEKESDEQGSS